MAEVGSGDWLAPMSHAATALPMPKEPSNRLALRLDVKVGLQRLSMRETPSTLQFSTKSKSKGDWECTRSSIQKLSHAPCSNGVSTQAPKGLIFKSAKQAELWAERLHLASQLKFYLPDDIDVRTMDDASIRAACVRAFPVRTVATRF